MSARQGITTIADKRAEEIQALPALSTFLPFVFKGSGYKLSNIAICCAACKKELGASDIRAQISEFAHSLSIEAWGVCIPCKVITPTLCRIGDGGEFLVSDGDGNWKKGSITEESSGWLARLKAMFSSKRTNHD